MHRFLRVGTAVAIILLVAAPGALAAQTEDPRGDIEAEDPVGLGAADLVRVEALLQGTDLLLRAQVVGDIKAAMASGANLTYTFGIGFTPDGTNWDLYLQCATRNATLVCPASQGYGNATATINGTRFHAVMPHNNSQAPWRVGAFSLFVAPGRQGFDATPDFFPTVDDPVVRTPSERPWWRTPWAAIGAAGVTYVVLTIVEKWWERRKREKEETSD